MTVVVGWATVVVLSGCASIFGLSSVPQVSSDPVAVTSAAPSKAAAVEFCENDFSATYQRGMEPDPHLSSIGYIELTNIGTTDCTLVGSPALAFSEEGDTTPEQAKAPNTSITDAYHRGRTPVVVPPQGKAYVWTLIVAHGGEEECRLFLTHKVTAIQVQLPGASKRIAAAANFERCPQDGDYPIKVGPIDSEPRYSTKGL